MTFIKVALEDLENTFALVINNNSKLQLNSVILTKMIFIIHCLVYFTLQVISICIF